MESNKKAKVSKQTTLGPSALGLTLFAAVFLGCNTGRVVLESCTEGDDSTCPEGKVCRKTTTTPPGKGVCVPAEIEIGEEKLGVGGNCHLGGNECEDGLLCVEAVGAAAGMGVCAPSSCTQNSQCPLGWTCERGVCVPGVCSSNNHCPSGWSCQGGKCFPDSCIVNADCAVGVCLNNACVTCEPGTTNGCDANTEICHATGDGMGVCLPTATCTDDADCNGGKCVGGQCVPACIVSADCAVGVCVNNACVTCEPGTANGCASTEICHATGDGMGVCLPTATCTSNADCNGGKCVGGQCVPACIVSADCAVGVCVGNACVTCEPGTANGCASTEICHATVDGMGVCLPTTCTDHADCNGGKCVSGQCVPACSVNADCASGLCLANGACATCDPANSQGCGLNEKCWATPDDLGVCLPTTCTDNADCNGGKCVQGQCVPACTVSADCATGVCVGNACVTCEPGTDNGCASTEICHATGDGMGVCLPTAQCTDHSDCNGGKCVNGQCVPACTDNTDCASGLCLASGACATCDPANSQGCDANEKCWATPDDLGVCLPIAQCNNDLDCNGGKCLNGQCVPACNNNADCATGVCVGGACVTCDPSNDDGCTGSDKCHATGNGMGVCLPTTCTDHADCNGGKCVSGQCVPSCTDNADCASGLCLANGACATCDPTNSQGCDTNEKCWATPDDLGVCLPTAQCTDHSDCNGGKCLNGQCVPACTVNADCATGVCVGNACVTCDPSNDDGCTGNDKCHATGNGMGVCLPTTTCTVDDDCNGGKCVSGQCVPACTDNADCASGLCLANGACATCDPANSQGCGLTEKCWATPDDLGICLPTAQCTTDADCNGGTCVNGQCVPACTVNADCATGVCVGNACVTCDPSNDDGCTGSDKCHATGDGMGVCLPTAQCTDNADCNGGKCVNGQCVPSCVDNADCASGLCLPNNACATCDPANSLGCDTGEKCWATPDDLGVCLPIAQCTDNADCNGGKCLNGQCVPACTVNADCSTGVCLGNACVICEPGTTNGCDVGTEICHATGNGMGVCLPTATCSSNADCNGGKCVGGQCVPGCTDNADCASGLCLANGACALCNPANNQGCAASEKCWATPDDLGVCRPFAQCNSSNDCEAGETCIDGFCRLPDNTCNPVCGGEEVCIQGVCRTPWTTLCIDDSYCAHPEVCVNGICRLMDDPNNCINCDPSQVCVAGTCRTPGSGLCETTADCFDGRICLGGACRTPVPDSCEPACASGEICVKNYATNVYECRDDNLVVDACRTLRPIDIHRNLPARMALGLPANFANNYVPIQRGTANTRGLMGVDISSNVAFLAWRHVGTVANLDALRQLAANNVSSLGGTAVVSSFTSWDAPSINDNALEVAFTLSGSRSPPARVNDIATSLLGTGTGSLSVTTTAANTQYVQAQYVLRGNGEVIVVMAVALDDTPGSLAAFGLEDVAGGASLAGYLDYTLKQCDSFIASDTGKVDFLFVVDDSGSMASRQTDLANAAVNMAAALSDSALKWRAAVVTSSYHLAVSSGTNRRVIRGFTSNLQVLQSWLRQGSTCSSNVCLPGTGFPAWTPPAPTCPGGTANGANGGCWVGISGSSAEGTLGAARLAIMHMGAPNADERIRFRNDASIAVILLTDAEDQTSGLYTSNATPTSWEPINNFLSFFRGSDPSNPLGTAVPVHAIYCPAGQTCGDDAVPAGAPTRIQAVVQATGGILMDIRPAASVSSLMRAAVEREIGNQGIAPNRPFIGASLRVALEKSTGTCNISNVPRSRQNGFDYDGMYHTLSFFGSCRPDADTEVTISYQSWEPWTLD